MVNFVRDCQRCNRPMDVSIMSRFNTELLCATGENNCAERERNHPRYQEAADAEYAAIKSGNLNFPGIGKPSDL